ncbi:MAG: hypothetical protein AB1649_20705 [Chloroflexota bacterium]
MNLLLRIFLAALIGLTLAFAFTISFMDLLDRPFVDQALLVFFAASAFGYLTFEILGARTQIAQRLKNLPSGLRQFSNLSLSSEAIPSFFREHWPGILLTILFFAIYLYLGFRFNSPTNDTVDNYLDADNFAWMRRIAYPDGHEFEMRGPHPFAYFVFRPLGWLFNLFTRSPYLSAVLINTLIGALCVFLAWAFIKNHTRNRVYSVLIAILLGLSTAHLFFGSVIESYIFSAAALMGFFLLLGSRKEDLASQITLGLLTFGITLTNFVQNFIGFVTARPRWREAIRFSGVTVSIGVLLSMIHAAWYPSASLFFLPSDAQAESDFTLSIFSDPAWRAVGRVMLLIRTILLYTVIAPQPFVFTTEVGGTFPRFNFFRISPEDFRLSSYDGLDNVLVGAWALMLLVAGILFLWNLIRARRADLSLAFALCLLFNFGLHLNYGYEPFLYSPDWAYALIFFVALGLAPLAKNRWFQGGLAAFLVLLAYNQWQFIDFIFRTVEPFIQRGG